MSIADSEVHIQLAPTTLNARGGLDNDGLRIAISYDIRVGIFEQPGSFSLQIGSGDTAASLIRRYPKNSPFKILIIPTASEGACSIFSGFTDGNRASGDAGGTTVDIKGRGTLKFFFDSFHEKETTYISTTFAELVEKAMDAVEMITPFTNGARPNVRTSNAQAREFRVGTKVDAQDDDFATEVALPAGSVGADRVVLRAKLGERWIDLLQRVLNQQGLFLWDAENGDIVVGRPNPNQKPIYRIVRTLGRIGISNVLSCVMEDDIEPRYSEVVVYGRASGRKYARTQAHGGFTDDELVNAGVHKILVLHDQDVTSQAHAELIAKRHLAAGRRRGFFLEYTVAGHCTQLLGAGKQDLIVWTPDTMCEVHDEQLGIDGVYWVESVRYRRANTSGTTTTIRLLDPYSLIFGTDSPKSVPNPNAAVPTPQAGVGAQLTAVNQNSLFTEVFKRLPPDTQKKFPSDVLDYFKSFPLARVFEVVAFIRTSHADLMKPPTVAVVPFHAPTFSRQFVVKDEFAKTRKATTHITFDPIIVSKKI